jgi:hypothetical protein
VLLSLPLLLLLLLLLLLQGWNLAGDLAAAAAADAAAAGIRSQGLVWQLMGSWNASSVPLRPADDCR